MIGLSEFRMLLRKLLFSSKITNNLMRIDCLFDELCKLNDKLEDLSKEINCIRKEIIKDTEDQKFITRFSCEGGDATNFSDMIKLINHKGFKNIFLIEGDVRETFSDFLSENQHIRFNFVHLDMDVYEPTLFVLDKIYDRLVKGGIIMIDDYNFVSGATRAVDKFLSSHQYLTIEKLSICHTPSFIIKPN